MIERIDFSKEDMYSVTSNIYEKDAQWYLPNKKYHIDRSILALTNGKVNIFDDAGEIKSTYEIIKDITDVWDELSIDERNNDDK